MQTKTIKVDVPVSIKSDHLVWEKLLESVRESKQDQEDVALVKEEMKKKQQSISLDDYLMQVGQK